ncbi:hypothetical protein EGH24_04950 [Halonotius terrestris]|uniref:Uncharacterized protein n=1 Tax=Halonotius terrestris TaxID=2487750 RepID=A0A8J8P8E3_9EURY|nr:hypothetical protein [Halonotius terrestris]TQQ82790.1 hypothetical protein EGH24_04950 [Halonotius terrestris]
MSDEEPLSEKPLTEARADQLKTACRSAVGDSCRSVTYFDATNYMQVYLRGDLEQDADLMSFIGHEWHDYKTTTDAYAGSELGNYEYTIRNFENGFLVRVGVGDSGVFVTTDGLKLKDFDSLVATITDLLERWE